MNKTRRKQLMELIRKIELLKDELDNIKSDEEYTFDNMPESLQSSPNGQDSEYAIDQMEDALDVMDEVIDAIERII